MIGQIKRMKEKKDLRRHHASGWSIDGCGAVYEVGGTLKGREGGGGGTDAEPEEQERNLRSVVSQTSRQTPDTKTKVTAHAAS